MSTIPEYQKIVAELRQCIKLLDSHTESEVKAKFDAYIEAVNKLNERLMECGGLIKQGLRAQAIQQAEIEPSLVEAVEALDVAELFQWTQLAKKYGCNMAPIDMDAAKAVNQAYDMQVPLEPLLRVYRRLALQRAPLSERLAVLRKIADTDSNTLSWQEDLERFERARIEELKEEIIPLKRMIDANVNQQNHNQLEKIFSELTESSWTEQPPADLARTVKRAKEQSFQKLKYEELKEIEIGLNEAYNELDIERGRVLRDRWDQTVVVCPLDFEDPVMARSQAPLGWIHEEDLRAQQQVEVQEAAESLEGMLDNGAPLADIDTQIARATKYDDPLPEYLHERIERYRDRRHRRRTQKFVALLMGIFLLITATGAVGFYIVKRTGDANQFENQVLQIKKLIDNESWESALAAINDAEPEINADPRVRECKLRAEEQLADITKWRENNKRTLGDAKDRFSELLTNYNKAETASTTENIQPFMSVKKEARSVAQEIASAKDAIDSSKSILKSDSDRATVLSQQQELNSLDRKTDSLLADIDTQTNTLFSTKLKELNAILKPIQEKPTELVPSEIAQLQGLLKQFQDLQQRFKDHVDNRQINRIKPYIDQITNTVQQVVEAERFSRQVKQLPNRMTTPDGYLKALNYIKTHWPKDPRTNDIRDSIKDVTIWSRVKDYSAVEKQYVQIQTSDAFGDFGRIDRWVNNANAFLTENPTFPHKAKLEKCVEFLTPVAKREDLATVTSDLQDLLSEPMFDEMILVKLYENGKGQLPDKYYLPLSKKPKPANDRKELFYFQDLDFDDTKGELKRVVTKKDIDVFNPAPQYLLKDRIFEDLLQLERDPAKHAFENSFRRMIAEVLKNFNWNENDQKNHADPIIRLQLLTAILKAACDASHSMQQQFELDLNQLQAQCQEIQNVNWVDPSADLQAENAQDRAKKRINEFLQNAQATFSKEKASRTKGWQQRMPSIQPYGVLVRDKNKNWVIVGSSSSRSIKNGTLHAPVLKADSETSFPQIGTLKDSATNLDQSQESYFQLGRPIFVIQDHLP